MTTPTPPEMEAPPLNGHSAQHTSATTSLRRERERFPAPPRDTLSILRTFLDTQQRRVGLWNEYQDAMEGHLQAVLAAGQGNDAFRPLLNGHLTTNGDSSTSSSHNEEQDQDQDQPARSSHAHSHPTSSVEDHHGGSTHYQSTPIPLSDPDLLSRIISLVTSGLLDCAHETRTIALELEAPSSSFPSTTTISSSSIQQDESMTNDSLANSTARDSDLTSPASPTNNEPSQRLPPSSFQPRPDLARLINKIQDVENSILRKIVRRDQLRRGWVSNLNHLEKEEKEDGKEQDSLNPSSTSTSTPLGVREEEEREVKDLTLSIERLRSEEIVELMEEIRGEMADLQLGSG